MIDIALFGPTMVWVEGRKLTGEDLGGAKPRQILEMLALAPGTPLPKDLIAERLWEGHPPASYVATLESYVCGLRRRLGLAGGRHGPLATLNKGYVLDDAQVNVDLAIVHGVLSRGSAADIATVVGLSDEVLLDSDPYAAWADVARADLDDKVSAACLRSVPVADAAGEYRVAVQLARAAVAHSTYSEAARQALMRALWHAGERSEAVLAYVAFRRRMVDELGVEPGRDSQALYVAILRDEFVKVARGSGQLELGLLVDLLRSAVDSCDVTASSRHAGMIELGELLLTVCADQPSRSIRTVSRSVPIARTETALRRAANL
ncbi:SARP family transcriptional regulator, regulator of embCAB operon [Marmoricola sp. URHA0025 HA25]